MPQKAPLSKITEDQLYLFNEGTNYQSYLMLGAHIVNEDNSFGVRFSVWAPNAVGVSVVGDFNAWDSLRHPLKKIASSGVWEVFVPNIVQGEKYKYAIETKEGNLQLKYDPYAYYSELRPNTSSIVYQLDGYQWGDEEWQAHKKSTSLYDKPISIYEVHLGSWRRKEDKSFLTYRDLADELVDYVVEMGYTHIELLPITEHPLDASWGYQVLGFYAATSRFGTPQDFMYFVDQCHQKGIGVILDWVPGHFPKDAAGLARFDGTALYEHADPRQGEQLQWGTLLFNYDRKEVQSFLISNAIFWLTYFHVDGFRVDAVASMLYLDFAKDDWIPNQYGGRENLEAISFMKKLNEAVYAEFPNTLMIAEESSEWPMTTQPTYLGGLGYNYKWNMGWMNDILKYITIDPIHRKWNHSLLTFSLMYSFSENFILPLSHDEVVHEKRSLLDKMPGDYWNKFAGLRALYGFMASHPGKKLLFMGGEFGQFIEWKYDDSLDWHLINYDMHGKMHSYVKELNHFYLDNPCLWEIDHSWDGFEWIDPNDYNHSILSFVRRGKNPRDLIISVINFTPVPRHDYRIGVPPAKGYTEVFNSDHIIYGGSGVYNESELEVEKIPWHKFQQSISISIPPLAAMYLKPEFEKEDDKKGGAVNENERVCSHATCRGARK
ncbi:MAG: 1,4-alpha-glucan branching protein GlgB [Clostridiales bacterium]|nr:1,4-alpha-glucan branching protein GlgB [Clostridiales bacterium]